MSGPNGSLRPSARPAPAVVAPTTKERRFILGMNVMGASPLSVVGRGVDRGANTLIGSATTDVGHRRVDVGVGRLRLVLEEGCRRHHHAALAITALRHVEIEPGLLHGMQLA